ncbi:MAG: hypothetical protein AAFU85_31705 [Planctomycetota bacterium]
MALILIATIIGSVGCRLSSNVPRSTWQADFQKADSLLIRVGDRETVMTERAKIDRLNDIYVNARWKPYRHTLPGNLGEKVIVLRNGDDELRRFSYTGGLWETESYTRNRTARLSDEDAKWVKSLFRFEPTRPTE